MCHLSLQAGQGFWDSPFALSLPQGTAQISPFSMSQCTLPLGLLQSKMHKYA